MRSSLPPRLFVPFLRVRCTTNNQSTSPRLLARASLPKTGPGRLEGAKSIIAKLNPSCARHRMDARRRSDERYETAHASVKCAFPREKSGLLARNAKRAHLTMRPNRARGNPACTSCILMSAQVKASQHLLQICLMIGERARVMDAPRQTLATRKSGITSAAAAAAAVRESAPLF